MWAAPLYAMTPGVDRIRPAGRGAGGGNGGAGGGRRQGGAVHEDTRRQ